MPYADGFPEEPGFYKVSFEGGGGYPRTAYTVVGGDRALAYLFNAEEKQWEAYPRATLRDDAPQLRGADRIAFEEVRDFDQVWQNTENNIHISSLPFGALPPEYLRELKYYAAVEPDVLYCTPHLGSFLVWDSSEGLVHIRNFDSKHSHQATAEDMAVQTRSFEEMLPGLEHMEQAMTHFTLCAKRGYGMRLKEWFPMARYGAGLTELAIALGESLESIELPSAVVKALGLAPEVFDAWREGQIPAGDYVERDTAYRIHYPHGREAMLIWGSDDIVYAWDERSKTWQEADESARWMVEELAMALAGKAQGMGFIQVEAVGMERFGRKMPEPVIAKLGTTASGMDPCLALNTEEAGSLAQQMVDAQLVAPGSDVLRLAPRANFRRPVFVPRTWLDPELSSVPERFHERVRWNLEQAMRREVMGENAAFATHADAEGVPEPIARELKLLPAGAHYMWNHGKYLVQNHMEGGLEGLLERHTPRQAVELVRMIGEEDWMVTGAARKLETLRAQMGHAYTIDTKGKEDQAQIAKALAYVEAVHPALLTLMLEEGIMLLTTRHRSLGEFGHPDARGVWSGQSVVGRIASIDRAGSAMTVIHELLHGIMDFAEWKNSEIHNAKEEAVMGDAARIKAMWTLLTQWERGDTSARTAIATLESWGTPLPPGASDAPERFLERLHHKMTEPREKGSHTDLREYMNPDSRYYRDNSTYGSYPYYARCEEVLARFAEQYYYVSRPDPEWPGAQQGDTDLLRFIAPNQTALLERMIVPAVEQAVETCRNSRADMRALLHEAKGFVHALRGVEKTIDDPEAGKGRAGHIPGGEEQIKSREDGFLGKLGLGRWFNQR